MDLYQKAIAEIRPLNVKACPLKKTQLNARIIEQVGYSQSFLFIFIIAEVPYLKRNSKYLG